MPIRSSAARGERSHSRIAPSDNSENAAAWEDPSYRTERSISGTSDRKRSSAAQLAQELGSSSPWSEAFMPPSRALPTQHNTTRSEQRQETGNIQNTMGYSEQELDPPPAYSNLPQIHELPATPVQTVSRPSSTAVAQREAGSILQANPEQEEDFEEQEEDDQAPLLGRVRRRWNQRGWGRWIHNGKTARKRHCRLLVLVIAFSLVASIIVCALIDGFDEDKTGSGAPSSPSMPLIPTGPEFELHQTTKSINGAYKLYQKLELTTTTGSINIEVDPQPGDLPAILTLSSTTGSITLRLSPDYLHRQDRAARPIHTKIRSTTGAVKAEILLAHGGYAFVETSTGSQVLSVVPSGIGRYDELSKLTTRSSTGAQRVTFSSLDGAYDPITNLRAEHRSLATASLDITYPSTWLGKVHATAPRFGHLSVQGDDLEYIKQSKSEIIAYRGPSSNRQTVEVISDGTGKVKFTC